MQANDHYNNNLNQLSLKRIRKEPIQLGHAKSKETICKSVIFHSDRWKLKQCNSVETYSHTSNTTCCNKSGNFCTIVTGWPDVKLTPYIGAVVLYRVLQRRAGVALHFSDGFNERAAKHIKHIHIFD